MTTMLISSICVAAFITHVSALVIPEELPSLLSLIYSNIPPIKKGTDSRVGLGFRLGPHADFQVLLELGPQRETLPIGQEENAKKRRQVRPNVAKPAEFHDVSTTTEVLSPGKWLHSWKSGLINNQIKNSNKILIKGDPTQSNDKAVLQLKQLYKNNEVIIDEYVDENRKQLET